MREAQNRGVLIAIARGPHVTFIEGTNLGVGRELHHAERHRRPREGMAVRSRPDEWVDERQFILCRLGHLSSRSLRMTEEQDTKCRGRSMDRDWATEECLEHRPMIVGS